MVGELRCNFGMDALRSEMDDSNRLQKFLPYIVLENVGLRAGFQSALSKHVAGVSCKDDDSRVRKFTSNRNDGVDAAHFRHLQIHKTQIRVMCTELYNRLVSIAGFRDQLHVGLIGDERSDSFAE